MMVNGERWERLCDSRLVLPNRPPATVRAWAVGGRVRSVRLRGEVWVSVDDLLEVDAGSGRRRSTR